MIYTIFVTNYILICSEICHVKAWETSPKYRRIHILRSDQKVRGQNEMAMLPPQAMPSGGAHSGKRNCYAKKCTHPYKKLGY